MTYSDGGCAPRRDAGNSLAHIPRSSVGVVEGDVAFKKRNVSIRFLKMSYFLLFLAKFEDLDERS